jgi:hypothetical protein
VPLLISLGVKLTGLAVGSVIGSAAVEWVSCCFRGDKSKLDPFGSTTGFYFFSLQVKFHKK